MEGSRYQHERSIPPTVPATPNQSRPISTLLGRLMTALDALESAVERRREADRDEERAGCRIQALGRIDRGWPMTRTDRW